MEKIPLVDLKAQYRAIATQVHQAIDRVIEQQAFIRGSLVENFESRFASFCSTRYCRGVGNGTDAIMLSLMALGVKPGDEVILPVNTFIATAEPIALLGAKPVFVDCQKETYLIDVSAVQQAITDRSKGIIAVDLYGQCPDYDALREICDENGLFLIEDAAQAHGAFYKGRRAGSLGDVACFSFYPGKNLGAYGDGGAITTDDQRLMERISLLSDHGSPQKYIHKIIGTNSRLDAMQAAVLDVKLNYIDKWNQKRRDLAAIYDDALAYIDHIYTPKQAPHCTHVYHLYVIRANRRDELMEFLKDNGIFCGIHYPYPLHLSEAFSYLGYQEDDFPVASCYARRLLSLPIYPELTNEQQLYVIEKIRQFYKGD